MVSPSDRRTAASLPWRRFGALISLLGFLWLWGAMTGAMPNDAPACTAARLLEPRSGGSAAKEPAESAHLECDGVGERVDPIDNLGGVLAATEVTESESDAEAQHLMVRGLLPLHDGNRLRLCFDPFVADCCQRHSQTRAPPRRTDACA